MLFVSPKDLHTESIQSKTTVGRYLIRLIMIKNIPKKDKIVHLTNISQTQSLGRYPIS